MRYFLLAGEASGDAHGARLIEALRVRDPQAQYMFCGGELMAKAAGTPPLVSYRELALMGFGEIVQHIVRIARLQRKIRRTLLSFSPDAFIPIDSSGFNMPLVRYAKRHHLRVFYYIPPKAWAWNRRRVRSLRNYTDAVYAILPFEESFFSRYGVTCRYFGNPLLDELNLKKKRKGDKHERAFREALGVESEPLIALIPGSREQEIRCNLPVMLRVAEQMPAYHFVITAAPALSDALYGTHIKDCGAKQRVHLIRDATHDAMRFCEAGLVTSGTATLEAALLGLPQVVVYRSSALSVWIARRLVYAPYISLVNLIMGRRVVTELIQEEATPAKIQDELEKVLPSGTAHNALQEAYVELSALLGEPGVSDRMAEDMINRMAL